MKHNMMRALALLLALLLVSALALTACNDDDPVINPDLEPKTAESVLTDAFQKLTAKSAASKQPFAAGKDSSLALTADLSSVLQLLGVNAETCTVALKGFFSGALTLDAKLGDNTGDIKLFFGEDSLVFASTAFTGGKAYSLPYEQVLEMLVSMIDFGGDDPDFPEEDLYYFGDSENEDVWYVFEGANAEASFPMNTYVVGDFDGIIAIFEIEDAAEVVPYEPEEAFENYEFHDDVYYVWGEDAMYGFTADTQCIMFSSEEYVMFYGNDGESYVIFNANNYSYIKEGSMYDDWDEVDEDMDYTVSEDADPIALILGEAGAAAVRDILAYVKTNADAIEALLKKTLDAAGTSFKANSTWTLDEAKSLTVKNHEMTVDNVTITVTENQLFRIATDVLNAIKSETVVTEILAKISALVGEEITVDAAIAEIAKLPSEQKDLNNMKVVISVDTATGLPTKAVVTVSDYSKETEDAPKSEVFDVLTVEYIDGYLALTVGSPDGEMAKVTTTWDTDEERTMAQTFVYTPMEDGKLGEVLMIDWWFYADNTYSISIVTSDLTMITLNGSYATSETEASVEVATVAIQSGEFQMTLPIHAVLTLKATDTAPDYPSDITSYEEASPLELMMAFAQIAEFLAPISGENF